LLIRYSTIRLASSVVIRSGFLEMIAGLKYVDAFINKIAQTAQSVARKWKVPASIVIAQAALETNWGRGQR
jgi:hypothetical protein